MKIYVPVMIQDAFASGSDGLDLTENNSIEEDFFLDGPVTRKVAVLDFDPQSGGLLAGVPFDPPGAGHTHGSYHADPAHIYTDEFMQVNVFGTVLSTIKMFEEDSNLGRPLNWAFEAPQLFIIPRAGEWENAYYERESHSLQFFYFPSNLEPGATVYTCLSHDIITHETGHAILDGIDRDLYNAITPQSIALHEAIADLTALVMAFRMHKLVTKVLADTHGSIANSSAFSSIAEEFGVERSGQVRTGYLRSLVNHKGLNPQDASLDEQGSPNYVSTSEPHELSQVLSGALYVVMQQLFEDRKPYSKTPEQALWIAAEQFKRMIFRALDYLPPGEVSFADYGRAIIASDEASHPDAARGRRYLREEFLRRAIVSQPGDLDVHTDFEFAPLRNTNLETLVSSDWAAYEFANRYRELLHIPHGANIYVRPRQDVTKLYYHRGGRRTKVRECIFKVSWDQVEDNPPGSGFPAQRQITVGTTLAIDWETHRVRALLTSEFAPQKKSRDDILALLMENNLIKIVTDPTQAAFPGSRAAVRAEVMQGQGLMRVRGSARLLHIIGEG